MQEVKICLDTKSFKTKPDKLEISNISNRIAKANIRLDSPESISAFVQNVALKGQTFCPATFYDSRRCKDSFEQQQLFALDFDNKNADNFVSFEEIKKRADYYDLPMVAAYETCQKMQKRISKYFNSIYSLDEFKLKRAVMICDFDTGSHEFVCSYIKVLNRIRMVKGYSPAKSFETDERTSFSLEGNSNGVCFTVYSLESHMRRYNANSKQFAGILRSEVHLTKQNVISEITSSSETVCRISEIVEQAEAIFHSVFYHIIPCGNFYKKSKACEIVRLTVKKEKLKRKMLRLITLIPEKKSLLLAQKALNCRDIDEVMREFKRINLSPVTISKRSDAKMLEALIV